MASDGDATYSRSSGAQLLEAFESIDRARFPKNYENLRRELASRAAPGPSLVEGGEVVELNSLPRDDTRRLLLRVVIVLALFELAGTLIGMFLASPFLVLLAGLVGTDHLVLAAVIGFILEANLYIGIAVGVAWAFLKWLLDKKKGPYLIRLIRARSDDT